MMRTTFLIAGLAFLCGGCVVSAAGSVAKAGAGAAYGVAKTGVKATGAAVDVVTPDGKDDHHDSDAHGDDLRPFDSDRDANEDVDKAFAEAASSDKHVLLVFGGNWCHDSRGLAAKFARPELSRVIADGYELVWVDVGYRDRNLDVPARFGVDELYGTPTVLILTPDRRLLNAATVHEWRTADSKPYSDTLAYFERFSPSARAAP